MTDLTGGDTRARSGAADIDAHRKGITDPMTAAIMPVHAFGLVADGQTSCGATSYAGSWVPTLRAAARCPPR